MWMAIHALRSPPPEKSTERFILTSSTITTPSHHNAQPRLHPPAPLHLANPRRVGTPVHCRQITPQRRFPRHHQPLGRPRRRQLPGPSNRQCNSHSQHHPQHQNPRLRPHRQPLRLRSLRNLDLPLLAASQRTGKQHHEVPELANSRLLGGQRARYPHRWHLLGRSAR